MAGLLSKCVGLTRSRETVSTLPLTRIFHDSAAPHDNLIWAVVSGGQRRCNCDSSQKYMRACVDFLILENVVLN